MKKSYLYLITIILSIFNLYYLFQSKIHTNTIYKNEKIIQQYSDEIIFTKKLLAYNYLSFAHINDSLNRYFYNDKFVLYITEGNCGSCIQESLLNLFRLSEQIGFENTILLGNFQNNITFEKYAKNADIFVKNSMNIGDIGFDSELTKQPTFFVLDEHMKCNLLFIPDYQQDYMDEYFQKVVPNYFKRYLFY